MPYAIVWSGTQKGSFWDAVTFKVGDDVDGEFVASGDFVNFKLKNKVAPPQFVQRARAGDGFKAQQIKEAQERTHEHVAEAQTRKQEAIQLAGAFRDATLVTLAMLKDQPFPTNDEFKREWQSWVKYFLGQADQPFF